MGRVTNFLKVDNFGNNHHRLNSNYYFSIEEYYQNEIAKKLKKKIIIKKTAKALKIRTRKVLMKRKHSSKFMRRILV